MTVTTVPIEFRRLPVQRARTQLAILGSIIPSWAVLFGLSGFDTFSAQRWWSWPAFVVLLAAALLWGYRREGAACVRLTDAGISDGRVEGRNKPWSAPPARSVAWDDIVAIKVTEPGWGSGWGSRRVYVFHRASLPHLLQIPRSNWLNPDPQFDARVALLREMWAANRAPLPPPPRP